MTVRNLSFRTTIVALFALIGFCPDVVAQNLTGYCLDNKDDGCQDRYIPFEGNSIQFCEEACTFTKPTSVRGLNATLYDFKCQSALDHSYWAGRVMILKQTSYDGRTRTSLVSRRDTLSIVRCK